MTLPSRNFSSRNVSRRRFLQSAAAAGAGLLAPRGVAGAVDGYAPITPSPAASEHIEAQIHLNQIGFLPNEPKRAVVPATGAILGGSFVIIDDAVVPAVRYRGTLTEYAKPQYGHFARHFFADFDGFARPGRYRLRLSDGHLSAPFSIGADIYAQLTPLVLHYFDVQRCGHQGSEHRGPCHTDDGIAVGGPRSGQRIDVSGGWHDAGDYLKFVETTSYAAALMLFAYERHPAHFHKHFPAPPGILPLPLRSARIGLDWLLKMHPSPNEFYYQVGDAADHDSWRLPEDDTPAKDADWKPRPAQFGVGANLAGRTAAALAAASRLFKPYDPAYAARCLASARTAFVLGQKNPKIVTTLPADFYPETTWHDDMEWGAVSLYNATGERQYLDHALRFARLAGPAETYSSVYDVHALAHSALYPHAPAPMQAQLLAWLKSDADGVRRHAAANPYGLGTPYVWGTAEAAVGAAMTCLAYARLSGDKQYAGTARRQRDFVLGCNPFGLSCLVGAGTRYPLFPHHQIANLKNIELTGAIVGGPADLKTYQSQHISLRQAEFSTQSPSPPPAAALTNEVSVYHDVVQDYVTNEPTNDYTAKFLLLAAFYADFS